MKQKIFSLVLVVLMINISGCAPLILGAAGGVLGGYAASRDTVQGETDKPYNSLWQSTLEVIRIRGTIQQEDASLGYIEALVGSSRVWIKLIRLSRATTQLRVSARKFHFPNLKLAEDIFVWIMAGAR